jgi:hypothetical protein
MRGSLHLLQFNEALNGSKESTALAYEVLASASGVVDRSRAGGMATADSVFIETVMQPVRLPLRCDGMWVGGRECGMMCR